MKNNSHSNNKLKKVVRKFVISWMLLILIIQLIKKRSFVGIIFWKNF